MVRKLALYRLSYSALIIVFILIQSYCVHNKFDCFPVYQFSVRNRKSTVEILFSINEKDTFYYQGWKPIAVHRWTTEVASAAFALTTGGSTSTKPVTKLATTHCPILCLNPSKYSDFRSAICQNWTWRRKKI